MPRMREMREYIIERYPSAYWKEKVGKMSTRQIAAIYKNIIAKEQREKKRDWYQLDFFDVFGSKVYPKNTTP